jgi:hypothetical protein
MQARQQFLLVSFSLLTCSPLSLQAQEIKHPKLDLAVLYVAQRSLQAGSGPSFWMQGGSIELGAQVFKGWGIAADVTGSHSGAIGTSTIPISLVSVTFGPRYRWHADKKVAIYGQGLIGEANGFRSLFPTATGTQADANSFASQVGGGLDYRMSAHLAARVVEATWLRTQLPNSTNNIQNNLTLGAGLSLRFADHSPKQ